MDEKKRMEILSYTALELSKKIAEGIITAPEAVQAVFEHMETSETDIHAYITYDCDVAMMKAEEIQKKIVHEEWKGPLVGVPVALKDNICLEGLRSSCGSKMLDHFIPSYSAEVVKRLEAAGAIVIGKTNMDEFAMGSTTETSFYGVTKNPRNRNHVPGGSSGGSAAAVAASECFFALGSDTGGSVRQPASYCGVVGMKPTYGMISRYGLVAYASSLDQIGPITKDVSDCAAVLECIASYDPKDSTSLKRKELQFREALRIDVKGMKIGIPREYLNKTLQSKVRDAVLQAAAVLEKQGAVVEEFDFPIIEYVIPTYYTIATAEASSNLERYDGIKYGYCTEEYEGLHQLYRKSRSEGFGKEVKRRIMLGSFILSSGYYDAYYLKALKLKTLIKKELDEVYKKYDIILGPTAPTTAPQFGESLKEPLKMYMNDIYTVLANLSGTPAISVPCGEDESGLPIGLQLMGDCFAEKKIIQAAYTYEQCK